MTNTDHIGAGEAADILGVDRSTLSRLVKQGLVPYVVQLPGKTGARVYSRADVKRIARLRSVA